VAGQEAADRLVVDERVGGQPLDGAPPGAGIAEGVPGDSGHQKIQIGGHSFPIGGQFGSRWAASSSLTVSAGWGREKQLPRRMRCSGLAALRCAAGLPPD
jgi:hypothetical protein